LGLAKGCIEDVSPPAPDPNKLFPPNFAPVLKELVPIGSVLILGCTGDINPPAPAPNKLLPTGFAAEPKSLVPIDSFPILGCTDDVIVPPLDANKLFPAVIVPNPNEPVPVLVPTGVTPDPNELLVGDATSNKLLPFDSATPEPNELIPIGLVPEPKELPPGDVAAPNEKLFADERVALLKVMFVKVESFELFSLDGDTMSGAFTTPPNGLGAFPGIGG
jgi:hypothetical protein